MANIQRVNRDDIKGLYSEQLVLRIYSKVAETNDFVGFVKQYLYDDEKQVVRNALCGLTKAKDDELQQLKGMMNELIDVAIKTDTSSSIQRPILGIIERIEMTEDDIRTDFLDFCLDTMVAPDEAPSIQALCMKLAYRMCHFYPELMEELIRILEAMEISYYTAAVKSVRRNILNGKYKQ